MTQLEFDVRYFATTTKGQKNELLLEYVASLKATIEAQEIIIKDKSAIMEAMAQPKTCEGCVYAVGEWGCNKQSEIECIRFDEAPDYYESKAQP